MCVSSVPSSAGSRGTSAWSSSRSSTTTQNFGWKKICTGRGMSAESGFVVTAKRVTAEDKNQLNGLVSTIMEKAEFDGERFTGEIRRAMSGRKVTS